jgi:hypothetical protein
MELQPDGVLGATFDLVYGSWWRDSAVSCGVSEDVILALPPAAQTHPNTIA